MSCMSPGARWASGPEDARDTHALIPCVLSLAASLVGPLQICKIDIHNMTIMRTHYEAKHPAVTLNEADYADA